MGEVIEHAGGEVVADRHGEAQESSYAGLIALAVEKDLDIVKIEKLMDLEERWEKKQARKAFLDALSAFQAGLPEIGKRGLASYPHKQGEGRTEFSFAKLEDIAAAIKPGLAIHGLSYRFEQTQETSESFDRQGITVTCIVSHRAGHSESTTMSGTPDTSGKKNPIQSVASTVSYLRRYTLTGALGITVGGEDDDAQSAGDEADREPVGEYYPQDRFEKFLPAWQEQILARGHTADQVIGWLASEKDVHLSPAQQKTLRKTGEQKQ
jgi:hypothetical protein